MNQDCKTTRDRFALMLYGELNFDEEERVEAHLDGCAECRAALASQKQLHNALDASAVTPSPDLLARSRMELAAALDRESPRRWWAELIPGLRLRWAHPVLQPLGAVALLTVGFFGAKLTPNFFDSASITSLGNARVRNVAAESDGRVQIVVDEPRERTIEGRLDDEKIRTLLMTAAKSAPDAGVRERTIGILVNGVFVEGEASQVRDALVFALANDENGRVRAKAMAGLKPYARELSVQRALAQAMLSEADVNMREQAVEMLTEQKARELNQQVVGSLQELMIREGDDHVREQVRRVLEAVNASPDMF